MNEMSAEGLVSMVAVVLAAFVLGWLVSNITKPKKKRTEDEQE